MPSKIETSFEQTEEWSDENEPKQLLNRTNSIFPLS